jgi:hypothetical protein
MALLPSWLAGAHGSWFGMRMSPIEIQLSSSSGSGLGVWTYFLYHELLTTFLHGRDAWVFYASDLLGFIAYAFCYYTLPHESPGIQKQMKESPDFHSFNGYYLLMPALTIIPPILIFVSIILSLRTSYEESA